MKIPSYENLSKSTDEQGFEPWILVPQNKALLSHLATQTFVGLLNLLDI